MTPTAAAWVRVNVLIGGPRSGGMRAGGPCHCQPTTPWVCNLCRDQRHDQCDRMEWGREQGLYGPRLAWPPRAAVWLADRRCRRACACPRCHRSAVPVPPPLAQLDLFGGQL